MSTETSMLCAILTGVAFQREQEIRIEAAAGRKVILGDEPIDEAADVTESLRGGSSQSPLLSTAAVGRCCFFHVVLVQLHVTDIVDERLLVSLHCFRCQSRCIFILF